MVTQSAAFTRPNLPTNDDTDDAGDDERPDSFRTCRQCGAFLSEKFCRVYGNNDDETYGCTRCTTTEALGNCAAVAPERDGTLYVHRPGDDEPVPATWRSDKEDPPEPERHTLEEIQARKGIRREADERQYATPGDRETNDAEFEALAAK